MSNGQELQVQRNRLEVARASLPEVKTAADFKTCMEFISTAKTYVKEVKEAHKAEIKEKSDALAKARKAQADDLGDIPDVIPIVEAKTQRYERECRAAEQRAAAEQAAAVQAAKDKQAAEMEAAGADMEEIADAQNAIEVAAPPPERVMPKVAGVTVAMIADREAIEKHVQTHHDAEPIPGVHVFSETIWKWTITDPKAIPLEFKKSSHRVG